MQETYVLYLEQIVHLGTPLPWKEPKQSPWYFILSFIFIGCTSTCLIVSMPHPLQPEVCFHDCFARFNSLLYHLFRHALSFFPLLCIILSQLALHPARQSRSFLTQAHFLASSPCLYILFYSRNQFSFLIRSFHWLWNLRIR